MRKFVFALVAAQSLALATPRPAQAQGVDDLLRLGTTILGGAAGHVLCRDQSDLVHIACIGGGGVLGYVVGDRLTRNDAQAYDDQYDECMNSRRCNQVRDLPDSGLRIEIQRGERAYMRHRRNARCRSFTEILTDRRGRILDQRTRYACFNRRHGRWMPVDRRDERSMRFYDDRNSQQRNWDYDQYDQQDQGYDQNYGQSYGSGAPAVVPPQQYPPVLPPQQNPPELLPFQIQ